ncbi:MAG: nitroreductase [Clostridiaceae bacterium]|mgnify:CR=1 FL=1|nr:nitroreductase [Clostridiaceae bacterium]
MDDLLYPMIFKRKSFHTFSGNLKLTDAELVMIEQHIGTLAHLVPEIRIAWKIVPRKETSRKSGEYCILFYSEKRDYYLYNIGYIIQQLDLWLASVNIGACWLGLGRTKEKKCNGLDYVIMLGIEKAEPSEFRQDFTKAKRKEVAEVWQGEAFREMADVVRYAPSACNTQPWLVHSSPEKIDVYRVLGSRGIMPILKVSFYNKIDTGIFLLFMELCLQHENIKFKRELLSDSEHGKENLVARYTIVT